MTYQMSSPQVIHWFLHEQPTPKTEELFRESIFRSQCSRVFYEHTSVPDPQFKLEMRWTVRFFQGAEIYFATILEQTFLISFRPCKNLLERILDFHFLSYYACLREYIIEGEGTSAEYLEFPDMQDVEQGEVDKIVEFLMQND